MGSNTQHGTSKRQDIQALRGFAVLVVVLYHAGTPGLRAGFLGVDIFFVVSGFLITNLVAEAMDRRRFSFVDFYYRRATRLLPAAYVVLAISALAAPYFLTSQQLSYFRGQAVGALTFTANIQLWLQTGYFDVEAATKPLLHFWSLAIEEQYYLLLPAILLLATNRFRLAVVLVITFSSLAYCFLIAQGDPSAKFYLLTSRAWELGVGSISALVPARALASAGRLFWPAIIVLLTIPMVGVSEEPPGMAALAVCLATAVIIARRQEVQPGLAPVRVLAWVGDFSYSLYLVHWPVFAFARSAYTGVLPIHATAICLAISLAGALALYHFVELPFLRARKGFSRRFVVLASSATGFVFLLTLTNNVANLSGKDFGALMAPNYGLARECDQQGAFVSLPQCRTALNPKVFVWGDSHGMHLMQALAAANESIEQGTRSACPPILSIAPFSDGSSYYTRDRAAACIEFNGQVLAYLETQPEIEIVVLGAALSLLRDGFTLLARDGRLMSSSPATVADSVKDTIVKLRAAGKRVVFAASPPTPGFDVGSCLERRASGLVSWGPHADCTFATEEVVAASGPELSMQEAISRAADVSFVGVGDFMCDSVRCDPLVDGVMLYIDSAHLSAAGSDLLGRSGKVAEALLGAAR